MPFQAGRVTSDHTNEAGQTPLCQTLRRAYGTDHRIHGNRGRNHADPCNRIPAGSSRPTTPIRPNLLQPHCRPPGNSHHHRNANAWTHRPSRRFNPPDRQGHALVRQQRYAGVSAAQDPTHQRMPRLDRTTHAYRRQRRKRVVLSSHGSQRHTPRHTKKGAPRHHNRKTLVREPAGHRRRHAQRKLALAPFPISPPQCCTRKDHEQVHSRHQRATGS